MGQGAVRSQMDLRISFRVREPRDVDLILGQGMLKAGWNAHKLNAPGKFLVSAPEHDVPRRARAYLVTDETVTETAALHAQIPRRLDDISVNAIHAAPATGIRPEYGNPATPPEETLWNALCSAPEEGWEIGELINVTGMTRTTLYRYLRELVNAGRAYQVSRGRWRARPAQGGHNE
jgi:S-DNA-T family DNA segregation ATPase FtsK/SpoIIIE